LTALVMAHLLTGTPAPYEYIEHVMCRTWHCPPSVMRAESIDDVYDTLRILNAESRAQG
jgi:hypothetical protein